MSMPPTNLLIPNDVASVVADPNQDFWVENATPQGKVGVSYQHMIIRLLVQIHVYAPYQCTQSKWRMICSSRP